MEKPVTGKPESITRVELVRIGRSSIQTTERSGNGQNGINRHRGSSRRGLPRSKEDSLAAQGFEDALEPARGSVEAAGAGAFEPERAVLGDQRLEIVREARATVGVELLQRSAVTRAEALTTDLASEAEDLPCPANLSKVRDAPCVTRAEGRAQIFGQGNGQSCEFLRDALHVVRHEGTE